MMVEYVFNTSCNYIATLQIPILKIPNSKPVALSLWNLLIDF